MRSARVINFVFRCSIPRPQGDAERGPELLVGVRPGRGRGERRLPRPRLQRRQQRDRVAAVPLHRPRRPPPAHHDQVEPHLVHHPPGGEAPHGPQRRGLRQRGQRRVRHG